MRRDPSASALSVFFCGCSSEYIEFYCAASNVNSHADWSQWGYLGNNSVGGDRSFCHGHCLFPCCSHSIALRRHYCPCGGTSFLCLEPKLQDGQRKLQLAHLYSHRLCCHLSPTMPVYSAYVLCRFQQCPGFFSLHWMQHWSSCRLRIMQRLLEIS